MGRHRSRPLNSAKCINTLDHQLPLTTSTSQPQSSCAAPTVCQHHELGLTNEKNVFQVCIWPQPMQRSQINPPIIKTVGQKGGGKKIGNKPIALSNNGRKTMSEWLRFLCSFCLHIIQTSILYWFTWTDTELFLLCWVDNEYSRLCQMLSIKPWSLPQDKTIYTHNNSV